MTPPNPGPFARYCPLCHEVNTTGRVLRAVGMKALEPIYEARCGVCKRWSASKDWTLYHEEVDRAKTETKEDMKMTEREELERKIAYLDHVNQMHKACISKDERELQAVRERLATLDAKERGPVVLEVEDGVSGHCYRLNANTWPVARVFILECQQNDIDPLDLARRCAAVYVAGELIDATFYKDRLRIFDGAGLENIYKLLAHYRAIVAGEVQHG